MTTLTTTDVAPVPLTYWMALYGAEHRDVWADVASWIAAGEIEHDLRMALPGSPKRRELPGRERVAWMRSHRETGHLHEAVWVHPYGDSDMGTVRCRVTVASSGEEGDPVSVGVCLIAKDSARCLPLAPPGIIRRLLTRYEAVGGDVGLRQSAQTVGRGQADYFLSEITTQARTHPAVLISGAEAADETAAQLARRMAGAAHVFTLQRESVQALIVADVLPDRMLAGRPTLALLPPGRARATDTDIVPADQLLGDGPFRWKPLWWAQGLCRPMSPDGVRQMRTEAGLKAWQFS